MRTSKKQWPHGKIKKEGMLKRALFLAVALLLLWAGSHVVNGVNLLWSATATSTDAGICFYDPDYSLAYGVAPNYVEYYAMHWDSMVAYGGGSIGISAWTGEDSVRFSKTCYSEPITTPYGMWFGAFAVHCIWYENDTIMAGGNVGEGADTLVGDSDTLITAIQTSVDGSVWEDIFTWAGQADTSTLFLSVEKDSIQDYRPGQFLRLKFDYSAWSDSTAATSDGGSHLTDNKLLVLWQFEGGYKVREAVKGQ